MAGRRDKHVVLSYQWDNKADVLKVYDVLTSQRCTDNFSTRFNRKKQNCSHSHFHSQIHILILFH